MDASLTDEQELLRDTVRQLATEIGHATTAELPADDAGDAHWKQLAQLDLLGLRAPETAGGVDASGVEVALCVEQLAAGLVDLPFVGSAVIATELLRAAGAERALLESLVGGALRLAPVFDPTLERLARRGEPGVAWDARGATAGVVLDPATGGVATLALGDARLNAIDLTRELRDVDAQAPIQAVGDPGSALTSGSLQRVESLALAALSADLVGTMQAALDDAVAHVREREQFGQPVGSFQAVQHMAAEACVSVEAARGCAWYAAWAIDALEPDEAELAARTAKAYCSEHGREVCETQIQMFGGIGMTWEYAAHARLRRALVTRQTLGDEHAQLRWIAGTRGGAA